MMNEENLFIYETLYNTSMKGHAMMTKKDTWVDIIDLIYLKHTHRLNSFKLNLNLNFEARNMDYSSVFFFFAFVLGSVYVAVWVI